MKSPLRSALPYTLLAVTSLALPVFAVNGPEKSPPPPENKQVEAGELRLVPLGPGVRIEAGAARLEPGAGAVQPPPGGAIGGAVVIEAHAQAIEIPAAEAPPAGDKTSIGLVTSPVPDFLAKQLKLPEGSGVMVRSLAVGGPAAKAGIVKGDIITKIDGKTIRSHHQMLDIIQAKKPGDKVEIESVHEGKPAKASVTLESSRKK